MASGVLSDMLASLHALGDPSRPSQPSPGPAYAPHPVRPAGRVGPNQQTETPLPPGAVRSPHPHPGLGEAGTADCQSALPGVDVPSASEPLGEARARLESPGGVGGGEDRCSPSCK